MSLKEQRRLPAQSILDRLSTKLKTGVASVDRVGVELKLNQTQIKFAKKVALAGSQLCMVDITMECYPNIDRNTAHIVGSQNMKHPVILALIDMIYVAAGLTDISVDKELVKTIKQDESYPAKVAGIKLQMELSGRYENRLVIEEEKKDYDLSILSEEDYNHYKRITLILESTIKKPLEIAGHTVIDSGSISEGGLSEEPV